MRKNRLIIALFAVMLIILSACGNADTKTASAASPKKVASEAKPTQMILATTTSTQDTGLLDALIPMFEKQYNVKVKTIAVGTGQALALGQKGEADVMLVHAPKSEAPLVKSEAAINYKRVMYNDFVLVGPAENPAGVTGTDINAAFKKIDNSKAVFISRGDDSGTNKKEVSIWQALNIKPAGSWYVSTGQGMGQTLLVAAQKKGYCLTDRGTWLAQEKNLSGLKIVVQGGKDLMNIYHVMQVNPAKFPKVNSKAAEEFVNFMVSQKTQAVIASFGKDKYGQALFTDYLD